MKRHNLYPKMQIQNANLNGLYFSNRSLIVLLQTTNTVVHDVLKNLLIEDPIILKEYNRIEEIVNAKTHCNEPVSQNPIVRSAKDRIVNRMFQVAETFKKDYPEAYL